MSSVSYGFAVLGQRKEMGGGSGEEGCPGHKDFRLGEVRLLHKHPVDWTEPQSINQKEEGFRKSFRNYFQTIHFTNKGKKWGRSRLARGQGMSP